MAYDFTSGSSHIITYGTTDLVGTGDFSVAAWIHPDTISGDVRTIICKRDAFSGSSSTGNNFHFQLSSGGKVGIAANTNVAFSPGLSASTGSWQFVGLRCLSSGNIYYLDASSDSDSETFNAGNDTGAVIAIGGLPVESAEFFDGKIAEVAAWQGDIGEAAMLAMAAGFSPSFFAHYGGGMTFYAPVIRDADAIHVNGLAATVTGAAVADHPPGIIYPSFAPVVFASAASGGGTIAPQLYHHRFHNLAA